MTSFIEELEQDFIKKNEDKVTFSIRLSKKEDFILQEVANRVDKTRQEILQRLINKHIVESWEKAFQKDKEADDIEQSAKYFLLNTNKVNDSDDHDMMMNEGIAAAFEDGYMQKIERIKEGDCVFLYESGQGIVGYGFASGKVEKRAHYGRENKTYYQKLSKFKKLSSPIRASEIKRVLEREFPFAQTLASINDGEKLLNYIGSLK